jgi:hypothetical protein
VQALEVAAVPLPVLTGVPWHVGRPELLDELLLHATVTASMEVRLSAASFQAVMSGLLEVDDSRKQRG